MEIAIIVGVVAVIIIGVLACRIHELGADVSHEAYWHNVYHDELLVLHDEKAAIAIELSEMEAAYRGSQIAHMRTTMEAEELQHKFEGFVDIAINQELNRLDKLYYSERLDQVIEFRELSQIGEL